MSQLLRFPAEWEPQSAVLLAWPHEGTDWADRLAQVEQTYVGLVAAITRFQPALVCVAGPALRERAAAQLGSAGVDMSRVRFFEVDYDDTWLRDSGPITLREGPGFRLLDFHFTAWGGKFEAGRGTLLSTWRCLHERHPGKSRVEITALLEAELVQSRTLWLDHGYLEGDDTDAHIDTLARFAAPDAIVFQACDDPDDSHYAELQAMAAELAALRTADGQPYRLFPLPWARPVLDEGRRLAASYANFLIINDAVLMPAYGDAADGAAAQVLAEAFPGREIVPVNCRPLIWQNGSLHCVTMQLPEGLLA